ncbi:MAG TPA: hypothetical protein VFO72_02380, partial [Pyrinomonadaceae bacterium]|nr:hypothetical protein [Pyrinomonadaceae bacterium]
VQSIDAASRNGEFLVLRTPPGDDFPTLCDSILGLLSANPGECEVALEALTDNGTIVRVKANQALRVKLSSELEEALKKLGCSVSVENASNFNGGGNGARV